ncbi:MAG TPA: DUF1294 domain-containing protein [Bacillales bacterium]|nr:DUF1294 domain-containing protein [Bacillales bacterium]
MNFIFIVVGYAVLLNVTGFVLVGADKRRARKDKWRIPEARLWLVAWIGGALGIWLGMKRFHHKTQHRKFVIGVPFLFFINLVVYLAVLALFLA